MHRLAFLKNPVSTLFKPSVSLRFRLDNIFLFPLQLRRMRITLHLLDFDGTLPGDPLAKDGLLDIILKFGPYPPDANAVLVSAHVETLVVAFRSALIHSSPALGSRR